MRFSIKGCTHNLAINFLLALLTIGLLGCQRDSSQEIQEAKDSAAKKSAVRLKILVQDDPGLVRAIQRLRGEWQEHSGGDLYILPYPLKGGMSLPDHQSFDVVIFTSRYLGELCENDAIREIRSSVVANEELIIEDFFPLIRTQEAVYGKKLMALPIGCPVPLLAQKEGTSVSTSRLLVPDDAIELACNYLAWAAPYVVHPSREMTLFRKDPNHGLVTKLNEAPFERALEEFVSATKRESDETCKIIWPNRKGEQNQGKLSQVVPLIPTEVRFSPLENAWKAVPERDLPVPLLATSGQLLAVTKQSKNAAAAFRFAAWLVSPANCRLLATSSDKLANPRGSFAKSSDDWLGGDKTRGKLCSEALADSLRANQSLIIPRIPGIDWYLKTLGKSVRTAVEGTKSPSEALSETAKQWNQMTQDLGATKLEHAYLRSLGQRSY